MPNEKVKSSYSSIHRAYKESVLNNMDAFLTDKDFDNIKSEIKALFIRRGKYASGALFNSLEFVKKTSSDKDDNATIEIDLLADSYWHKVEYGSIGERGTTARREPQAQPLKRIPTENEIVSWMKSKNIKFLNEKLREKHLRKGLTPMTASWEKDNKTGINRLFGITRQSYRSYARELIDKIEQYGTVSSKYEFRGLFKGAWGKNIPDYKEYETLLFDEVNNIILNYIEKKYPQWTELMMSKSEAILDIQLRYEINRHLSELKSKSKNYDVDYKDSSNLMQVRQIENSILKLSQVPSFKQTNLKKIFDNYINAMNKMTDKKMAFWDNDKMSIIDFLKDLEKSLK